MPERLWDTELGYRLTLKNLTGELTGYYMSYEDQLVLTGRLNDVGAYTRVNVTESYRAGIETSFTYSPLDMLSFAGHATLSKNKIKAFDEYIDNWDSGTQEVVSHSNTDIAFSPSLLAGLQGEYDLISGKAHEVTLSLGGNFIGKQFLDNTSRQESLLEDYFVTDAGLQWTWHSLWANEINLRFFVKNLFDHSYESNGWIYRFRSPSYDPTPDDPYAGPEGNQLYHLKGYFPQAGRHFFITLEVAF
jgi:iron complex outermembrane receptor protein